MGGFVGRVLSPWLVIAVLGLAMAGEAIGRDTLVLSVRGNEEATRRYVAHYPERVILDADAREFPNGNTFVRLLSSVIGRTVEILLPPSLTPDTLMETLIKIRTAKSNGAREVRMVLPGPTLSSKVEKLDELSREDMYVWFGVAGADSLVDHGLVYRGLWASSRRAAHSLAAPEKSLVLSTTEGTLGAELAQALKLPFHAGKIDDLQPYQLRHQQVFLVAPPVMPVNETFFKTLLNIRALRSRGASVVLVTPYLPYARSDKKDQAGVTVTGRFIADMLERVGIDAVSFARAHAPQSEGFFSVPAFHVSGRKTINKFLRDRKIDLVISPDAGFQKDATLYADELGVGVVVLNKQRDLVSGKAKLIEMSGIDLTGKTVAIIDDETASGGTLALAAAFLKEKGATRVIAVVTHLTGDAKAAVDSGAVDELAVTNTLPVGLVSPKVRVLSIAEEMASELAGLLSPFDCANALVAKK